VGFWPMIHKLLFWAFKRITLTLSKMGTPKYVLVVGASAGGLSALSELVGQLSKELDVAVFIVMHLSRIGISNFLVDRLKPLTSLQCVVAEEGATIEQGYIYVAQPNQHLLVKKGIIVIGRGPEENRWRPSIDVLFRSAAAAYSTRAIGVVLTGLLDDGTTGMLAIKRSGGVSIVQDPNEAEYPDMPLSVLNNMDVDYCVSLQQMGLIIAQITLQDREEIPAPNDIVIESEIAERVVIDYDNVAKLGVKSIYACPDCGGGLWNISKENGPDRYRCHIGHSYSEGDLEHKQVKIMENTLWIALRIMEERKTLLNKMEIDHSKRGLASISASYRTKKDEIQIHIDRLKEVVFATQKQD